VRGSEISLKAQSKGMLTLGQEALLRVYQGILDLESVESFIFAPSF